MNESAVESQGPLRAEGPMAEFETVYRANFGVVTAFFARRAVDPQTVADLTSDTFVEAIMSFPSFDPGRGSARAWLLGIARRVFARHCETANRIGDVTLRLAGHRLIDVDETAELIQRIDAAREGRVLLAGLAGLSPTDQEVIELVDIVGMAPREAAAALGTSSGAVRIRLFRARKKLRALAEQGKGKQ